MIESKKDIRRYFTAWNLDHEKINFLREKYLEHDSLVPTIKDFLKSHKTDDQLKLLCQVAYGISLSETRYLGYDPSFKNLDNPEVAKTINEQVDFIIRDKKPLWNYKEEPSPKG